MYFFSVVLTFDMLTCLFSIDYVIKLDYVELFNQKGNMKCMNLCDCVA